MEFSAPPQAQRERSRVASFLPEAYGRARSPRIPFRVAQVLMGDDPFNGRHLGTLAVVDAPFIGLQTAANAPGDVIFYDYRQLRYPDQWTDQKK